MIQSSAMSHLQVVQPVRSRRMEKRKERKKEIPNTAQTHKTIKERFDHASEHVNAGLHNF